MRRIGVLALVLFVLACEDSTAVRVRPPFLTPSVDEIDFGEVEVGLDEKRVVYFINRGDSAIHLEEPADDFGGVFQVLMEGTEIAPGQDLKVHVIFSPSEVGPADALIRFPNNSTNEPAFSLAVKGTGLVADPCRGLACDTPPGNDCINSTTSRHYEAVGSCVEGKCVYPTSDETCSAEWGCDAASGQCGRDPCIGVVCGTPPASSCVNATTSRRYEALGTCTAGVCAYPPKDEACAFGCDAASGLCARDPCIGVTCQAPPNGCYTAQGTCSNGSCIYTPNQGASCSDGDPCTEADSCHDGMCRGTAKRCTQPPAAYCVNATTRRSYVAEGVCDQNGQCQYAERDTFCDFGCTAGRCKDDPCAGGCDDGNACTRDTCDQRLGCQHAAAPQDGSACTTRSGDCPQGTCAGGTCRVNTGVACVATYDVDLCQDAEIAGICASSGECTVTEAPPEYQCPDCNGLCIQCYILQLCIPL